MGRNRDRNRSYFESRKAAKLALDGQAFVPHTLELLTSRAWRDRGWHSALAIDRLEIEHARHAGKENGYLRVTHDQFVEHGISRRLVKLNLDWLQQLGLLQITHQGTFALGGDSGSHYRLTYLHSKLEQVAGAPVYLQPTNEWKKYRSGAKKPTKPASKKRDSKFQRMELPKSQRVELRLVSSTRDSKPPDKPL